MYACGCLTIEDRIEISKNAVNIYIKATLQREDKIQKICFLVVKLLRAHDECLGTDRRGRTWQAAKSFGESHTDFDPEISEWGNPAPVMRCHPSLNT